jgi:hypothetical protein
VCFSTEAKVPTLDPKSGGVYGTAYWTGPKEEVLDDLKGDDSALIMDRALAFIAEASDAGQPFFAVVWFHAPHRPVVASEEHDPPSPAREQTGERGPSRTSAEHQAVGHGDHLGGAPHGVNDSPVGDAHGKAESS